MPGLLLAAGSAVSPAVAHGQGGIDPRIAPRAAELIRTGERQVATDMLGGYLATAHEDGAAWLQLGRLYLFNARDWHALHVGEPDAALYLEFAAAALDQSGRLVLDSGTVYRALVEVERATLVLEQDGWALTLQLFGRRVLPALPPAVRELGENLLASCPSGGVLLTGGDTELVATWYAALDRRQPDVVIPIRSDMYATDARYRDRIAALLGVDPRLPLRDALAAAATRRPVCISPSADEAAVPVATWRTHRLARVSIGDVPADAALSFTALAVQERSGGGAWLPETREVYERAATRNPDLCPALRQALVGTPPAACRP
ncbi:MAG: hypothetical protein MUC69_01500 [Gemmatimonadales bacterium]|nr:hypothetical protein [Gemmatimonadales bacterium]